MDEIRGIDKGVCGRAGPVGKLRGEVASHCTRREKQQLFKQSGYRAGCGQLVFFKRDVGVPITAHPIDPACIQR